MTSPGSDSFLSTPPGRELLRREEADGGGSDQIPSLEDMALLFSISTPFYWNKNSCEQHCSSRRLTLACKGAILLFVLRRLSKSLPARARKRIQGWCEHGSDAIAVIPAC